MLKLTRTSSPVVPKARCSTFILTAALDAPIILTPLPRGGELTSLRTSLLLGPLCPRPSAAFIPFSTNLPAFRGFLRLLLPLAVPLVGKSSSPALALLVLIGGAVPNPCSLGVDPDAMSSLPWPPDILLRSEGLDEDELILDARELFTSWCRSCVQAPSGFPLRFPFASLYSR